MKALWILAITHWAGLVLPSEWSTIEKLTSGLPVIQPESVSRGR